METACNKCKKDFDKEKVFECLICCKEDDTTPLMFCRGCTDTCFACYATGCTDCVKTACCDCGVAMCKKCKNNETPCGCSGKCFWCNRALTCELDGWTCWVCSRWGCYDCRLSYNDCKECNPYIDLEWVDEEEEEEEAVNNIFSE